MDVPFEYERDDEGERTDAFLLWSGRDDLPPVYREITYVDTGDGTAKAIIRVSRVEDGEVVTTEETLTTAEYRRILREAEEELRSPGDVGTEQLLPCGPCLPNLNCWYRLSRAYAGIVTACSLCAAFRNFQTCATCIGTIISAPRLGFLCDPCTGPAPLC
ncbi:hypothetical protein M0R88_15080 [Halorussus gelatinilyticus]|uniref:Uncharacterized protein n=1 Tax=Halorussus gelatinilyticus TaxID=2937524 RepID=A0A8U0IFH6_9EURY|nr:hypothetical protein [Halorussus gelatinilyticus]UPV99829.1 hypothetical protein M0R88_15080 [Halorussus gelatinilyticus]